MSNSTIIQRYFPLYSCVRCLYKGTASVPSPMDPHDDTKNITWYYTVFRMTIYDDIVDRFPDEWLYFSFMWAQSWNPSRTFMVTSDSQVSSNCKIWSQRENGVCEFFAKFSVSHPNLAIISMDARCSEYPIIKPISMNAVNEQDYVFEASRTFIDPVDWITASVRNYYPNYSRQRLLRDNPPVSPEAYVKIQDSFPQPTDLFAEAADF